LPQNALNWKYLTAVLPLHLAAVAGCSPCPWKVKQVAILRQGLQWTLPTTAAKHQVPASVAAIILHHAIAFAMQWMLASGRDCQLQLKQLRAWRRPAISTSTKRLTALWTFTNRKCVLHRFLSFALEIASAASLHADALSSRSLKLSGRSWWGQSCRGQQRRCRSSYGRAAGGHRRIGTGVLQGHRCRMDCKGPHVRSLPSFLSHQPILHSILSNAFDIQRRLLHANRNDATGAKLVSRPSLSLPFF
jgi:hypothetical protein